MSKVILTNRGVLERKYGRRTPEIDAAVNSLIASDKNRGIETSIIFLDAPDAMKGIGAVVSNATDQGQTKAAIDAVYKKLNPDYMLLLGSQDVVCHQNLRNPAYHKGYGDSDEFVPSDLPYACEAAMSTDPKDFTAITRVVGRLPDLTGASDPSYLLGLLKNAANATALTPADFGNYFGITAQIWEASTRLSLQAVFGSSGDLQQIPPSDYKWNAALLGRRAHFINCHGAPSDWRFYGQPDNVEEFPVAQDGTYIPGKVTAGTVVAAECCYGARLYDPTPTKAASPGLCNVYLGNGAYGFFGSTTIAYGPASSNDWADYLCQYFWREILRGSSLGSAVLRARQEYVRERPRLGPIDLKTLAQFLFLGDPSIHPVSVPVADQPMPQAAAKGVAIQDLSLAVGRADRRRSMVLKGVAIANATAVAIRSEARELGQASPDLQSLARGEELATAEVLSYDVQPARILRSLRGMHLQPQGPERVHLIVGRRGTDKAPIPQIVAIEALEHGGQIVNYRVAYSRG